MPTDSELALTERESRRLRSLEKSITDAGGTMYESLRAIHDERLYRDKFARITPMLQPYLPVALPDAGFYYWVRTPIPDTEFARRLQAEYNVTVLPGSYLAREANGVNPGAGFVRIALVADTHECVEAAGRIIDFCKTL